jgi:hypothetical protein
MEYVLVQLAAMALAAGLAWVGDKCLQGNQTQA